MSILGSKPMAEWIKEYGHSHQHPANQVCHTIGIPLIALSLPVFLASALSLVSWKVPVAMFVGGWILQFIGHAVEQEPPEFFRDWRFLFVGLRWWFKKVGW